MIISNNELPILGDIVFGLALFFPISIFFINSVLDNMRRDKFFKKFSNFKKRAVAATLCFFTLGPLAMMICTLAAYHYFNEMLIQTNIITLGVLAAICGLNLLYHKYHKSRKFKT